MNILFAEKLDIQYSRSSGPGGQHVNKGNRLQTDLDSPGPEVIKFVFMLSSAEHETLIGHKYQNTIIQWIFQG